MDSRVTQAEVVEGETSRWADGVVEFAPRDKPADPDEGRPGGRLASTPLAPIRLARGPQHVRKH